MYYLNFVEFKYIYEHQTFALINWEDYSDG
jgi:hypothetical protein